MYKHRTIVLLDSPEEELFGTPQTWWQVVRSRKKKDNLGLIRIKTFGSEQDPVKMKDQLRGGRRHLQRSDLTQGQWQDWGRTLPGEGQQREDPETGQWVLLWPQNGLLSGQGATVTGTFLPTGMDLRVDSWPRVLT